jgi:hypothetical protein
MQIADTPGAMEAIPVVTFFKKVGKEPLKNMSVKFHRPFHWKKPYKN